MQISAEIESAQPPDPLVSVVIASFNMAEYLPFAIESALHQTYGRVEIVVVDDGSTDDTASVMQRYRNEAKVRYCRQDHGGQATAKNRGIQESAGDYIAFLDADDMWTADKLARQLPLFAASPTVGVVYSRVGYVDGSGSDTGIAQNRLFRGTVSAAMLVDNFIGFGSAVVRRECFARLGAFREELRMGIDYDLWLRFSTKYEFDYVDAPLLRYRVWAGQMSKNCEGRYRNGVEIMRRFLSEYPAAVDRVTQDRAWAHTYVGYGECMRRSGHALASVRMYFRALRHRPSYLPAWKALVRAIAYAPAAISR